MKESSVVNNELIFQNIWNSCASGSGCPRYIRENLIVVLNKSREPLLWNPVRLDPEDDSAIAELARELDTMTDHLEYIESQICAIAMKYRKKGQGKQ